MADSRQQAPDIQPLLRNPRLYDRVRPEGGIIGAAVQSLGNLGTSMANRAQNQQAAQNEAALDEYAMSFVNQNKEFVDDRLLSLTATAGPNTGADADFMNEAQSTADSFRLLEGQGRRSNMARIRALAETNRLISMRPDMAREIMDQFKDLTGQTYFQSLQEERETSQANEIAQADFAQEQYEALSKQWGFNPGTSPEVVFNWAAQMGDIERQYQVASLTYQTMQAKAGSNKITAQRQLATVGPVVQTQVVASMGRFMDNLGNLDEMPNEERRIKAQEAQSFADNLAYDLLSRFPDSDLTIEDVYTRHPILGRMRDLAVGVLDRSIPTEEAENYVAWANAVTMQRIHQLPGATEAINIIGLLDDVNNELVPTDAKNYFTSIVSPAAKQIYDLNLNGLIPKEVSSTPNDPETGGGTAFPKPGEPGSRTRVPVQGWGGVGARGTGSTRGVMIGNARNDITSALNTMGLTLGAEGMEDIKENFPVVYQTFANITEDLSDRPSKIPTDMYRQLSALTATPEGVRMLERAEKIDGNAQAAFTRGYNEYLLRTAASLADDLRSDINLSSPVRITPEPREEDILFSFLGINVTNQLPGQNSRMLPLGSTIEYQLFDNGTFAFKPRPEFSNSRAVTSRVRDLNRNYARSLQDQVKSYAHMMNKNEDYKGAFQDLMEMGEFAVNDSNTNILAEIQQFAPDLQDLTEEEVRAARQGTR